MLLELLLLACHAAADNTDSNIAQEAFQQGRYGEALTHWEAALPRLSDEPRIDALLHMAATYQALGRAGAAIRALDEAHTLANDSGDRARQALVLGRLSDSYLVSRQLEEAECSAEQSLSLTRESRNPVVIATALGDENAGNIVIEEPVVLTLVDDTRIEANNFGSQGGFISLGA